MWGRTCAGAGGNPSSLPWRKKRERERERERERGGERERAGEEGERERERDKHMYLTYLELAAAQILLPPWHVVSQYV